MSGVVQLNLVDTIVCSNAGELRIYNADLAGEYVLTITQPDTAMTVYSEQAFEHYYYMLGNERIPAQGNLTRQNLHQFSVVNFTDNLPHYLGDTEQMNLPNFTTETDAIGASYNAEYWENSSGETITSDFPYHTDSGTSELLLFEYQIEDVKKMFDGYFSICAGAQLHYPNAGKILHCDSIDFTKIDENTFTAKVGYTVVARPKKIKHRHSWNYERVVIENATYASLLAKYSTYQRLESNTV